MVRNRMDEPMHVHPAKGGPTRTKQSEANDVNVNEIIKRHRRTGVVTHWSGRMPMYGDFSAQVTLQDSLNLVLEAQESFMSLPAEVRRAAKNDPVELLRMLATEEGSADLVAAGLEVEPRPGDSDYEPAEAGSREGAPAEPSPSGEAAPGA